MQGPGQRHRHCFHDRGYERQTGRAGTRCRAWSRCAPVFLSIRPARTGTLRLSKSKPLRAPAALRCWSSTARTPDELAPAFDRLTKGRAEAVIVAPNGMFINQRRSIVQLALAAGMPTIFQDRQDVETGGLASYGVEQRENHRRSALFVDKILKGAKPGDLPIEFPTKLLLVVNLKTARALGIAIPPTVLGRADEVIE